MNKLEAQDIIRGALLYWGASQESAETIMATAMAPETFKHPLIWDTNYHLGATKERYAQASEKWREEFAAAPPKYGKERDVATGKVFYYSPYNAEYVEMLKGAIPWGKRGWDPEKGCWWVDPDYEDSAQAVWDMCFAEDAAIAEEEQLSLDMS